MQHPGRIFWLVAIPTLLLDQFTKSVVRVLWDAAEKLGPLDALVARLITPTYGSDESVPIIGEALQISHVRNTGAAFGFLPGYRPIFVATSIIVLIVVWGYWRKVKPTAWPVVIGLGFVTGGAVGNLIDRALVGRVTDFVDFAAVGFPVFNVADTGIVVGVAILIAWLLFGPQPAAAPGEPVEPSCEATGADAGSDAE